jgi:hypothetical protein
MRRLLFASILVLLIIGAASANGLSEAMDTSLIFETGGDGDWFSQTRSYYSDHDAAQSGDIGDGQVSWMQTTIHGSGKLSFYWKVSSERHYDDLNFYIDGVLQDHISETVDWHKMTYEITASGLHTLEWRYVKDYSKTEGDDCCWVDLVEWSGGTQPPLVNPLSEALDTSLNLTTGGEAKWLPQVDSACFDGDAAKSGNVENNQESYLQTTVYDVGTISFDWKVCSEADGDFLDFYIDGVLQDQISGLVDWHRMVYTIIEPGTHILEWRYVKDDSVERNDDCGWVDHMEWSGRTEPLIVIPLSEALDTSLNLTTGGEAEWLSQEDTAFFDGDAAMSGNVKDNQESFLQMTVDGYGTISFYWKVGSEVGCDFLEFYIDGVLQDQISGLVDWHPMFYTIIEPGTHTLEWRYVKDDSFDGNDDCGWVDHMEWIGRTQPPLVTPLSKALDTSLILTTGGEAEWFSQMDTAFFDGDAADAVQSGDIADGQVSWMQTTIYGSGTLSFYWKVSSERHYDDLNFFIDGVLQDHISEIVDWHQMTYEITTSGLHTLEWRYVKDHSKSEGDDCGWVDLLEWSGETSPSIVTPLSEVLDTSLNLKTGSEAE